MRESIAAAAPGRAAAGPGAAAERRRLLQNRAPLQAVLASVPLLLAAWAVYDYPVGSLWLAVGLIGFALASLLQPALWLFVIPCLIPLLDLAPWSGRLFLQDLDCFLLVAFAMCLWHGHYRPSRSGGGAPGFVLAVLAFALSCAWSTFLGMQPVPPLGPNSFTSYFSNYNALRVARGVGWALVLWPSLALLFRRQRRLAVTLLFAGVTTGLLGTGLVALWERGVWTDLLFGSDIYQRLRGLLDFATAYRVTGLFSSMHTGGEAIDGYLALAWPIALGLALVARRRPLLIGFAFVTLPLGLYAAAVTFSRASYLALALGMACFGIACLTVAARRSGAARAAGAAAVAFVFVVLCMLAYPRGGMLLLAAAAFAFGLPALVAFFVRSRGTSWLLAAAVIAAAIALAIGSHAIGTSKWAQTSSGSALALAAVFAVVSAVLGSVAGKLCRLVFTPTEFLIVALVVGGAAAAVVPALMGFRMGFRFAGVTSDLQTRSDHWQDALDLMPDTWSSRVFGVGLGVFPRRYHFAFPERGGGIGVLGEEGTNGYLRLTGGKDLKITQRVDLPAGQTYVARLDYRTEAEQGMLRLQICRRHIIHPTEYNGLCRSHSQAVQSTGGEWKTLSVPFDIGNLGSSWRNLLGPPLVFEITNRREYALSLKPPAVIDVDNVQLIDAQGYDQLANGSFSARMDRWFALYDFNHLPWHIKNMAIALYFEQGLVGCVSFALVLLLGLGAAAAAARDGDSAGLALLAALLAFLGVGLVGTMLDEPRLMLLFFLYLFAAVANRQALLRQPV